MIKNTFKSPGLLLILNLVFLTGLFSSTAVTQDKRTVSLNSPVPLIPGDTPYQSIASVCTDQEHNSYVLDGRAYKIYKFSKTGALVTSFGQKGEGPGDLTWPYTLYWDKNRLVVNESRDRVSIFDGNGKLIKRLRVQEGVALQYINEDLFQARIIVPKGRKQVFIDKNGKIMRHFSIIDNDRTSISLPDESGRYVMFNMPSDLCSPFFLFNIQNGVSALGTSDKYEITVVKNHTTITIKRDIPRPSLSTRERNAIVQKIDGMRRYHPLAKKKLKEIIPEHKNFFSQILVSERYIWAFLAGEIASPVQVDLFSHNGSFMGTKELPGIPVLITGSFMYFSLYDEEDDEQKLVRYNYQLKEK